MLPDFLPETLPYLRCVPQTEFRPAAAEQFLNALHAEIAAVGELFTEKRFNAVVNNEAFMGVSALSRSTIAMSSLIHCTPCIMIGLSLKKLFCR